MRRQIRLLVENLFDGIYDDEVDLSSELQKEYFDYNIGDIYYRDKVPYAICCGEAKDFNDNNPRFLPIKINFAVDERWVKASYITTKLPIYDITSFPKEKYVNNIFVTYNIDENGFRNTQIIKNKCKLKNYPAFNYCCEDGNDYYLPAIYELQIFFKNFKNNNNLFLQYNKRLELFNSKIAALMSSTAVNDKCFLLLHNDTSISACLCNVHCSFFYVLPFIKI